MTQPRTPFAWTYGYAWRPDGVYPTLAAAVKRAQSEHSPSSALHDSPVWALYADEDRPHEQVDLTPFTETVDVPTETLHELALKVQARIEESKKRYDELIAALPPGERLPRFSGQHWLHEIGFEEIMRVETRKLSLRWRELS